MGIIEVKNLSRTIQKRTVLKNINLTLSGGTVYGIYGRNGSGKTMFLRCLAGIIKPTEGEIIYNGEILHKTIDVIPDTGVIIENVGFWKMYSGYENLSMLARIRGTIGAERIKEVLELVGLDPQDKRSVRKYSLGMRQRLAIAQAIMEYPQTLILDEPTNALDEEGVELFHNLIRDERKKGTLIVLASHNQEDIRLLADVRLHMVKGELFEERS